jgi:hypothetical protein
MRLAAPVAAVVAKADALPDLHPLIFAGLLLAAGLMIADDGLKRSNARA